jgi:hypothetical protein
VRTSDVPHMLAQQFYRCIAKGSSAACVRHVAQILKTSTDEDIYNSVKKSIKSCDQAESNGGDDNSNDDAIIEASSSHHDALMTASVLTSFMHNLNDPLAHRLEDILVSFKRQVHLQEIQSKHATRITDYFSSM